MLIDLEQLKSSEVYHWITQTIIPRPIAWVLTTNEDKSHNLTPFSYFTPVSSKPPVVMISVGKKSDGSDKDTVTNIRRKQAFTIHIASLENLHALNASSQELPLNCSEVEHCDIELAAFDQDDPEGLKRVANAPIALACEFYDEKLLGDAPQTLVFAKITALFIDDKVIQQDDKGRRKVCANEVNPLARLGASEYANLDELTRLKRP